MMKSRFTKSENFPSRKNIHYNFGIHGTHTNSLRIYDARLGRTDAKAIFYVITIVLVHFAPELTSKPACYNISNYL